MRKGNLGPVGTQLIGDNLRQRRPHVLTHFCPHDVNQHLTCTVNLKPNRGREDSRQIAAGHRLRGLLRATPCDQRTHAHHE